MIAHITPDRVGAHAGVHRAGQPALSVMGLRAITVLVMGIAVLAGLTFAAPGNKQVTHPTAAVPHTAAVVAPALLVGAGRSEPVALVGSTVDGEVFTAARLWDEGVNWCDLAPTADADIPVNLQRLLAPKLDRLLLAGTRRVVLTLGHPAPWVFGNHPAAQSLGTRWSSGKRPLWFCSGATSGVSIPSPASLKPFSDGSMSVQQRRFANYAGAVIEFIAQRYQTRLSVDLQVWNEPNLLNGIDTAARIPGTARSVSEVVASLRAYERLVAAEIAAHPGGRFRLISPSFYQRMNSTMRTYLAAENRQPQVSALSFNFYSHAATPQAMISNWDYRVGSLAKFLRQYRNLRALPRLITETNHNLNNHRPLDRTNASPLVTATASQRRLATTTQLNAMYWGFASVYWLLPMRNQAAVALSLDPDNPARQSLADLVQALGDRELTACGTRSGNRTCYFADPAGVLPQARALWRMSGTRWIAVSQNTSVMDLVTGAVRTTAGEAIKVSTNPIVIWQGSATGAVGG